MGDSLTFVCTSYAAKKLVTLGAIQAVSTMERLSPARIPCTNKVPASKPSLNLFSDTLIYVEVLAGEQRL